MQVIILACFDEYPLLSLLEYSIIFLEKFTERKNTLILPSCLLKL